jgi:hypothetical protein
MVERKGKEYHKTTVEFDVPLYKDIKVYCAKHGLTEKEFFDSAIREKLESPKTQHEHINYSHAAIRTVKALSEIMPDYLAKDVLCAMCNKLKLKVGDLKNDDLCGPLRDEILRMVEYWSDVPAREYMEREHFDRMFGKRKT